MIKERVTLNIASSHRRVPRPLISKLARTPRISIPALLLMLVIIIALFPAIWSPHDRFEMDTDHRLIGPSATYLLGTDEYGRDLLSRLLWGAQPTITVAVGSVALAVLVGVTLGVVGGFFGGLWETLTMRATDAMLTIPPILLAVAVVAFLGSDLRNLIIVIGILYSTRFARITYASVLQVISLEYIEASRALGASSFRTIFKAILPNIIAPILVQISLTLGMAILLESGLSFLGLGTLPPEPSWGNMIGIGRGYLRQNVWYVVWPSAAISLTIVCCNLLGDGLRDVLDPRLRDK